MIIEQSSKHQLNYARKNLSSHAVAFHLKFYYCTYSISWSWTVSSASKVALNLLRASYEEAAPSSVLHCETLYKLTNSTTQCSPRRAVPFDSAMRTKSVAIFCALLLLLPFFVGFPSPSSRELAARIWARKLVQPVEEGAIVSLGGVHGVLEDPAVEVSASLRKLPPSKSNPSHNKEKN